MIHLLSRHIQQFHYEKAYWLSKAEGRRRAIRLGCMLVAAIILGLFLWIRG